MTITDSLMYVVNDSIVHIGFGAAVSLADYSKVAFSSQKGRIADKKEILDTMSRVLDAQPKAQINNADNAESLESTVQNTNTMSTDSIQYAQNIATLKEYFVHTKVFKEYDPGFFKNAKEYFKNFHKEERINNASTKGKWINTFVFELGFDTAMAIANYSAKSIEAGVSGQHTYSVGAEIGKNIWEIPSFYVGILTGKYVFKPIVKLFVENGEERKLNRAIKQTEKKTSIVDIVFNYVPPVKVAANLDEDERKKFDVDINFTRAGKRILSALGKPKEYFQKSAAERKAKYETQKEEIRNRFNDITKGY
ncbi:MAG: hypothetical protein ACP5N1_00640 [Candidatus Woesearchaeota archaeon]